MVMPFSFSKSIESIRRSSDDSCWLARKVPDCLSRQSTSVVLPWSTCAMMAIFLMCCIILKPSRTVCLFEGKGQVMCQKTKDTNYTDFHRPDLCNPRLNQLLQLRVFAQPPDQLL